ncbi:MAG TPA: SRPBCC family protein [Candidatus Micrarchaeia archaeon]|nr:SRPBCC family protein [Candidatus Micrarchaeia archaeon]
MILENHLAVGLSPDALFPLLEDLERVAPCLPGATITERVDPKTYRGRVTVKVGPITVAYEGTATVVEADPAARRLVMRCEGRDPRGAGSAVATITATVEPGADGGALGRIHSDVAITGRIAQFGRGVIEDVATRLLTQFAECLERSFTDAAASTEPSAPAEAPDRGPIAATAPEVADAVRPAFDSRAPVAAARTPGILGLLARVLWARVGRLLGGGRRRPG